MSLLRNFRASASASGAPATVALVVTWILMFLLAFMTVIKSDAGITFRTAKALAEPWTILTYSFATWSAGVIGLLFSCLWFWGVGGSTERELGTPKFVAAYLLFVVLSALALLLGAAIVGANTSMAGPWVAVSAITVIWGTRNPDIEVLLMFVIPIKGKYLAWLSAALVFFGVGDPKLAPFAAIPLILAYFFAANKLPGFPYSRGSWTGSVRTSKVEMTGRGKVVKEGYFEDVRKREKEREERERLRKLFEGSMGEDDK